MKNTYITARECIALIEEATHQFGFASYYEGIHEVMDLNAVLTGFKTMPAHLVAAVLLEVASCEAGRPFVSTMLGIMNGTPQFDKVKILME